MNGRKRERETAYEKRGVTLRQICILGFGQWPSLMAAPRDVKRIVESNRRAVYLSQPFLLFSKMTIKYERQR